MQGQAKLGKALGLGSWGRRWGGGAQGKPAVTALALISWLQSRWRGSPALVCALLTQASKTFVS